MWSGLIGQWPSEKKLQKFARPLALPVKVFNCEWPFPKISKLPKDLKQNVNWNQTLLNEVEFFVKWSWNHQFLFSRGWACWLPLISMHYSKQKVKKLAKLERNIGTGKKHWNWKETLELERNFGALADSPSMHGDVFELIPLPKFVKPVQACCNCMKIKLSIKCL